MRNMVKARVSNASEDFSILGSESQANTVVFPLMREEYRGKTKIKWLGDFEALKSFAFGYLKLDGEWSFTSNNGGFHVLKSESVTLSFYPNTKTLNVQGMLQSEVKERIISFIPQPTTDEVSFEQASENGEDGAEAELESEDRAVDSVEDDSDNIAIQANDSNVLVDVPPNSTYKQCCLNCKHNTAAIADLSKEFVILKAKVADNNMAPSYQDLLDKIKVLEEERDSLLTALRLLKEDFNHIHDSSRERTTQQEEQVAAKDDDAGWTRVKRKGRRKQQNQRRNERRNDHNQGNGGASSDNTSPNRDLSSSRPREKVAVVGDSVIKFIQPRKLSRKFDVSAHCFPGATVQDMNDYIKPVLQRKPDKIVLHVGTNNLRDDRPKDIKKKIAGVVEVIKNNQPSTSISISSIIQRADDRSLKKTVEETNKEIRTYCATNGLDFICNDNINDQHLNTGGLHLNRKGVYDLVGNFRKYLNSN